MDSYYLKLRKKHNNFQHRLKEEVIVLTPPIPIGGPPCGGPHWPGGPSPIFPESRGSAFFISTCVTISSTSPHLPN